MKKKELLTESKAELIERARELELPGRSKMSKEELAAEIAKALTRATAARSRRARVPGAERRTTATAARRALEERSRRRAEERAEEKAAPVPAVPKPAPAPHKPVSQTPKPAPPAARPSRAAYPQQGPPGIESLDLDEPSTASTAVQKKTPPPAAAPPVTEDRLAGGPLPQKYGHDRFVLLTRDPQWLFAYWEITPETERELQNTGGRDLAGAPRILRVYDVATDKTFDIRIHPGAKSWYVHLPVDGRTWKVEIGYVGHSGKFYRLFESNLVTTPRKSVSNVIDERYGSLDDYDEAFALSGGREAGKGLQGFGGSAVPGDRDIPGWSMSSSGGLSSRFLTPLAPTTDDFNFWVNTEVVLHGGTQPDATVTVRGEKVDLRPDGTFTLRFSLPEGEVRLPCKAVRADGKKVRKAEPIVRRSTK